MVSEKPFCVHCGSLGLRLHPPDRAEFVRRYGPVIRAPADLRLLQGQEVEATPEERVLLGLMLGAKQRYGEAIASFLQAFREKPELETGSGDQLFHAIRTGILGGEPHRAQSLRWMRAWLERLRAQLETDPAATYEQIYWWKRSQDFASVRVGDDLPEEWQEFWADAEALQQEAKETAK